MSEDRERPRRRRRSGTQPPAPPPPPPTAEEAAAAPPTPPSRGERAFHTTWPLAAIGAMAMVAGNPMEPSAPLDAAAASGRAVAARAAPVATRGPLSPDHMTAHFIDVDQGSAALLEFPCGAVMIDAGARDAASVQAVVRYLDAFFARRPDLNRRLDTIFITHTHVDHNRALKAVAEKFTVGGYVYNGILTGSGWQNAQWMATRATQASIATDTVEQSEVEGAGAEGLSGQVIDSIACTRVDPEIHVLAGRHAVNPGWSDGEFDNGNNQSLVIRVDYGKSSFLFTGDLEEAAIESLVEEFDGTDGLQADVYVVGHHGSRNGTTPELLEAVRPEIAVLSMGRPETQQAWTAWAYGHPRRTIIEMLDRAVSRPRDVVEDVQVADRMKHFTPYTVRNAVYATGWDGTVRISGDVRGELRVAWVGSAN